ncbi:hypothetical protein BR63_03525 [Thermanaerosceptrum fracticalcis]|jgi:hypothetical protein|uniref:Type I restriction modification DNA specificity domain-containing protein n=1 Tax=Thermanaerosceptrum fracticalcis TaxID=1712410 RepID=A0A7G6E064_THEFR|nr:hypothetical protein [Thermanaerosceptrum fracticalcis]QNB45468.1 hypothetical protein BR63_03525 [Thermanaerosceptrum fracticalcis]
MHNILIPDEILFENIIKKKSLSPNNYKQISIKRKLKTKISTFLSENVPYVKGEEPGSITYVKKSAIRFLRNSCINKLNVTFEQDKLIYLNPHYGFKNMVNNFDILMCKDANIGDACLYIDDSNEETIISSGVLKLNFREEKFKYYCLAFMKDDYFLEQLDSKTPKGSTIRHSGDLFMECFIPQIRPEEEWVYDIFEALIKNLAFSEKCSYQKLRASENMIETELMQHKVNYENPTILKLLKEKRVDAGIYSKEVFELNENVRKYKNGYFSIEEFGFKLKRGPNLAKRDLGRSIQTKEYRPNYHILVYPSDISEGGYILENSYIGARNPVWYLEHGNILFSAEGTVGKIFIICDDELKFTTNFHGMIICPSNKNSPIEKSIFLGLYLNYLRAKGIFKKLSVGGQGGSFAVGYWNTINIPNFTNDLIMKLAKLYHNIVEIQPFKHEPEKLKEAGIFELNNFRILCFAALKKIVADIKNDNLKDKDFYLNKIWTPSHHTGRICPL